LIWLSPDPWTGLWERGKNGTKRKVWEDVLRASKVDLNGWTHYVVRKESNMLWTIFVILLILWLLGFLGGYAGGGLIHILLVVAIIVVVIQVIQGRRG